MNIGASTSGRVAASRQSVNIPQPTTLQALSEPTDKRFRNSPTKPG